MNKAKLFVLGMSLGFGRDHEIFEGIELDEDMGDLLQEGGKISKSDMFSVAPNGKSIFQFAKTWESFDKVLKLAAKNGETITHRDLGKTIADSKSAIDMAAECDSIGHVFEPELWKGHAEEFENLFFSLKQDKRKDVDFYELQAKIAALSGKKTRAAVLKEAGIETSEVRTAFGTGDLDKFVAKLADAGLQLTLDDVKLVDREGDHTLYAKASWEKFEKIHAALVAAGEVMDPEFFFFKRGDRDSIVGSAFKHDLEDKIFNREVFKGRPGDLMEVFNRLNDAQASKIDIDAVLTGVIEDQLNVELLTGPDVNLSDLLTPLFNDSAAGPHATPVMALGLKKTWEHMDKVAEVLKSKGEVIKLETLRAPSGNDGESCLIKAAKYGRFDKVMMLLKESGEYLTDEDLLQPAKEGGKSLLDVLQETDSLQAMMDTGYWSGRSEQLVNTVWSNLKDMNKTKYKDEFRVLLTKCNIEALKKPSGPTASL